jgi:hypothetical protein
MRRASSSMSASPDAIQTAMPRATGHPEHRVAVPSASGGNLGCVPTTTVVREAKTAPHKGVRFGFADGGKTFVGIVVAVRKLSPTHVTVEVEVSDSEYARLLGSDAV